MAKSLFESLINGTIKNNDYSFIHCHNLTLKKIKSLKEIMQVFFEGGRICLSCDIQSTRNNAIKGDIVIGTNYSAMTLVKSSNSVYRPCSVLNYCINKLSQKDIADINFCFYHRKGKRCRTTYYNNRAYPYQHYLIKQDLVKNNFKFSHNDLKFKNFIDSANKYQPR